MRLRATHTSDDDAMRGPRHTHLTRASVRNSIRALSQPGVILAQKWTTRGGIFLGMKRGDLPER